MGQLGWMYENGYGVEMDLSLALEQYRKAGAKDYAWAWHRAGSVLLQSGHPFSDAAKARRAFGEGAALKDKACMRELGRCLLLGLGGEADVQLGTDWLQKAAEAGDGQAAQLLRKATPVESQEEGADKD
jgi:TPR repeat protein